MRQFICDISLLSRNPDEIIKYEQEVAMQTMTKRSG